MQKAYFKYLINAILYVLILFLVSCSGDDPEIIEYIENNGVFICNEGNFTFGNSSLSFYAPDSFKVHNQVFYNTNGFPPGDVLQSARIKDSLVYMVINNSGKIFIINSRTFRHVATIPGLSSPRYIEIINESKAYVSQLHSPYIRIVDLKKNEISGEIFIGRSTERLLRYREMVFVTSWSFSNKLYLINAENDILLDSLEVVKQPNSLVMDKNEKLWVLSDGGFPGTPYGQEKAALTRIDANSFQVEKVFRFDSENTSPTHLNANSGGDTLFFINSSWTEDVEMQKGVYRMHINDEVLPETPVIEEGNKKFYGLAVNPQNSDVYISDALDGVQKGWVYRFNSRLTLVDSFRVDILPGNFCFNNSN